MMCVLYNFLAGGWQWNTEWKKGRKPCCCPYSDTVLNSKIGTPSSSPSSLHGKCYWLVTVSEPHHHFIELFPNKICKLTKQWYTYSVDCLKKQCTQLWVDNHPTLVSWLVGFCFLVCCFISNICAGGASIGDSSSTVYLQTIRKSWMENEVSFYMLIARHLLIRECVLNKSSFCTMESFLDAFR